MLTDASAGVRVGTGAVLGVGPSWWGDRRGGVGLGVTVGAGDDHVEPVAPSAGVGCGGVVNDGSPKCTLVVGN